MQNIKNIALFLVQNTNNIALFLVHIDNIEYGHGILFQILDALQHGINHFDMEGLGERWQNKRTL